MESEFVNDSGTLFPMKPIASFKLDLMNYCYFHKQKTIQETRKMLQRNGDFFFQDYKDTNIILSALAGNNVIEFIIPIIYCHMKECIGFSFCEREYRSLEELVLFFSENSGNYIVSEEHQIRLIHPIYRAIYAGLFGYGEIMNVQDIIDPKKNHLSYIRSLRRKFASLPDIVNGLEKLISLNHCNLVKMRDFYMVDMGRNVSPLVIIRCDAHKKNLFERLHSLEAPLSTRKYINWSYQAGKALNYLMDRDIFHRRLHPRACLLEGSAELLKLSDFWTKNDVDDFCLYQREGHLKNTLRESAIIHRDGWRYLPIETLLNGLFDSTSQVWTYALLIWQIFTHCQLANRIFYVSLADFLGAGRGKDDLFFMPGHLTRKDAQKGMPETRRRQMIFYKLSENFPKAPESFAEMIPRCLSSDLRVRPYFSELLSTVEREKRVFDFSFLLSKFV